MSQGNSHYYSLHAHASEIASAISRSEMHFLVKSGFTIQAVRMQLASIVIDDHRRWSMKSSSEDIKGDFW